MRTHGKEVFYFGGYVWRRCDDGHFRSAFSSFHMTFHEMLWDLQYGRKPDDGCLIIHADRDIDNQDVGNLRAVLADPSSNEMRRKRAQRIASDPDAAELLLCRRTRFFCAATTEEGTARRKGVEVRVYRDQLLRRELERERIKETERGKLGSLWYDKYLWQGPGLRAGLTEVPLESEEVRKIGLEGLDISSE